MTDYAAPTTAAGAIRAEIKDLAFMERVLRRDAEILIAKADTVRDIHDDLYRAADRYDEYQPEAKQ